MHAPAAIDTPSENKMLKSQDYPQEGSTRGNRPRRGFGLTPQGAEAHAVLHLGNTKQAADITLRPPADSLRPHLTPAGRQDHAQWWLQPSSLPFMPPPPLLVLVSHLANGNHQHILFMSKSNSSMLLHGLVMFSCDTSHHMTPVNPCSVNLVNLVLCGQLLP